MDVLRGFPFGRKEPDRPETAERPDELQEREPTTADGNKRLADQHLAKGRLHYAITRYKKAARIDDDSLHRTDLGDAYALAELPINAVTQYRKALKRDPNSPEPHFSIAEVYARYGKWDVAIHEYSTAVDLSPGNAFYRYKLSGAYKIIGQTDHAIAQMEYAVASKPADAFYHFELGLLYSEAGRMDEAIPQMEQAVSFSPGDDYYAARLGMFYARVGRYEDAAEAYLEAARLNYKPIYACLLGDTFIWRGDEERAEAAYEDAGDLDPYDMDFLERTRRFIHGGSW
ncbi:MAG: tetratricopeptide repeat protein [Armatimonadetes bacterium]|nr:tetratricopeptide repeat protein [Armatimonadota bacterium]